MPLSSKPLFGGEPELLDDALPGLVVQRQVQRVVAFGSGVFRMTPRS